MEHYPAENKLASPKEGFAGLSGNALKLIAAVAMFMDHMGMLLFPGVTVFRAIGRLAFPIYAFMLAQGCRYTKNRLRYFLSVFVLGVGCQVVYLIAEGSLYMNVLITFSCSLLVIFAMQDLKEALFAAQRSAVRIVVSMAVFAAVLAGIYLFTCFFRVDYGISGAMLPVFASLLQPPRGNVPALWKRIDRKECHVLMLGVGLVLVCMAYSALQMVSLLALPLLLLYSGKRGKGSMKYFFYIFYPVHLALLQCVAWLLAI